MWPGVADGADHVGLGVLLGDLGVQHLEEPEPRETSATKSEIEITPMMRSRKRGASSIMVVAA